MEILWKNNTEMSRGSRSREAEYGREERRSRPSENSKLESRVYIGNINIKNFSYREINDWMSKYGKVLDVVFCDRHILVQFDRESEATRAIDREKGQSFRGTRFDIRFAHSSDGSLGGRAELQRSRSPRILPYERDSRDMSPGYRDTIRERSPIDRLYKERRPNSPDYRNYDRPRMGSAAVSEERARSNVAIRPEFQTTEYQEPNWNAPPLTNKITTERPGFDAAIIVMSSDLLAYAETIESKLQRQIALTTHIIVLKEESHANACIDDLNNKAVLYAFLVNHMNEKHLSCTLRILYGSGQEHRNMLLANALTFVSRNFEDYQKRVRELKSIAPKPNYDPSRMPPGFVAPDDKTIYQLHLLADSRMLTIEELNEVDDFIQKRIRVLAQAEGIIEKPNPMEIMSNESSQHNTSKSITTGGMSSVRDEKSLIAQQNQLHSKILNILKPNASNSQLPNSLANINDKDAINSNMDQYSSFSNSSEPVISSSASTAMSSNPLTNPKVQQALDSLMQSRFRPSMVQEQQQEEEEDIGRNYNAASSNSLQNNQYSNNQYSNANMNPMAMSMSQQNPNMHMNQQNPNMNPNMNPMSQNPNMNPNMNMNQGMQHMNRGPMSHQPPMRPQQQQQQQAQQYSGNYPGYYQPAPAGQPLYRARPPYTQPRPQYPGYQQ